MTEFVLDFRRPGIVVHTDKVVFQGVDPRPVPPRRVLCIVSDIALQDRGGIVGNRREDWHAAFNAYMDEVFAAADRKYRYGDLEPDGSVLVATADLNP